MENKQKAINMMMMFERMLQEQREMSEITMVVQRLVQWNGQFNGKDVSRCREDSRVRVLLERPPGSSTGEDILQDIERR